MCNLLENIQGIRCGLEINERNPGRPAPTELMITYSPMKKKAMLTSNGEYYSYDNITFERWKSDYDIGMSKINSTAMDHALGFKLMYDQVPPRIHHEFVNFLAHENVYVLHLVREATLQKYASAKQHQGLWHAITAEQAAIIRRSPKIQDDPSRIVKQVLIYDEHISYWRDKLSRHPDVQYFEFTYESLQMPKRRASVLRLLQAYLIPDSSRFMNIDLPVEYQSTLYKLHSSRCVDRFENYEKIMNRLRHSNSPSYAACRMLDKLAEEEDEG